MLTVRHMCHDDLPAVLACESKYAFLDPDLGIQQLPEYAWTVADIIKAVRQYRSSEKGTHDTRAFVAVADQIGTQGAMIYALAESEYEILLLTTKTGAPVETREALLEVVLGKASRSETRKKVKAFVRDGDYELLSLLKQKGFVAKLIPDYYKNVDAWLCQK